MKDEYEKIVIKQQRWLILGLCFVILIILIAKISGVDSISFILTVMSFSLYLYSISKSSKKHSSSIVKQIQKIYFEDTGKRLNIIGWMSGKMADMGFFYFPEEGFGIEWDYKDETITGKKYQLVYDWSEDLQKNTILQTLAKEQIQNIEKEKIMEEKGYAKKD